MSQDSLLTLLIRMHAHQELIAEAYHHRDVYRTEENERALSLLTQSKVLMKRGSDTYTLHVAFRRFLDSALNIERMFKQGAEIGAAFERIVKLADSLFDAAHEGRLDDRNQIEDEMILAVYELADDLSSDIAHLRSLVETRFGAVRTLSEKRRQNEYYLNRTSKAAKALEQIRINGFMERLEADPAYDNVIQALNSQIFSKFPANEQSLLDIMRVLKEFLFEYREIEDRTRKIRDLALFLDRNPGYEPKAWDEEIRPPTWLGKVSGLEIAAWPHVYSPCCTDVLAEIALGVKESEVTIATPRTRGTLLEDDDDLVVELSPKAYQVALDILLSTCRASDTPQSALAWHRAHPETLPDINAELWLQCLADDSIRMKAVEGGVTRELMTEPLQDFDGNLIVRDVIFMRTRLDG